MARLIEPLGGSGRRMLVLWECAMAMAPPYGHRGGSPVGGGRWEGWGGCASAGKVPCLDHFSQLQQAVLQRAFYCSSKPPLETGEDASTYRY